jgi:hypothetical protein
MRIIRPLLALLFALTLLGFAALQLNDPDPIVWAGFYSVCALVPLLLLFERFLLSRRLLRPLFWLCLLLCGAQLLIAAPGAFSYWQHSSEEALMQAMNPAKPYIEAAREFLGALIALLVVSASGFMARQQPVNR